MPGVDVPGVVVGVPTPVPAPDPGTLVVPGAVSLHGAINVDLACAPGVVDVALPGVAAVPVPVLPVVVRPFGLVVVPVVPTADGDAGEPGVFRPVLLPVADVVDPDDAGLFCAVVDEVPGVAAVEPGVVAVIPGVGDVAPGVEAMPPGAVAPAGVFVAEVAGVHGSGVALGAVVLGCVDPGCVGVPSAVPGEVLWVDGDGLVAVCALSGMMSAAVKSAPAAALAIFDFTLDLPFRLSIVKRGGLQVLCRSYSTEGVTRRLFPSFTASAQLRVRRA